MNARFLKLLDYPEASLFIDSEDLHDFENESQYYKRLTQIMQEVCA